MDSPNLLAPVLSTLTQTFSASIQPQFKEDDMPTLVLNRAAVFEAVSFLKTHPVMPFQFLTTLCGVHYPPQLGVVYHLHSLKDNLRIRLKAFAPENDPVFDSLTPLFAAANWMEREAYDFFGLQFKGHPNLIRILNVDDMTVFPMRKEIPLEDDTRTDKEDAQFGR